MADIVHDKRGSVAVLVAGAGFTLVAAAAAAVDLGSIHLVSRRAQGAADLAAISAAGDLARGRDAARKTALANLRDATAVDVAFGAYTADPRLKPSQRFQEGAEADAARVTVQTEAPLYFGAAILGRKSITVRRTATAAQARLGSFALGTRLAALRGGVANAMLSAFTGSEVSLSVMDYNALLGAEVSVFQFMDALRTEMKLTAVSYDTLLNSEVKAADALKAAAAVLEAAEQTTESRALSRIALAMGPDRKLKLGKLIDLGPYQPQDNADNPLDVSVGAYDLASAVLTAANSNRHVELDLDKAGIPGLADVQAWLAIGEPPAQAAWLTIGRAGEAQIRTAQARLLLNADLLAANPLGGLLPLDVPVLVELASAEARLSAVRCGRTPASRAMTVQVRPAVATVSLGDVDNGKLANFNRTLNPTPATLANAPGLRVRAHATVRLGGEQWRDVTFTGADIDAHKLKTVASSGFVGGLAGNLMKDVHVDATVAGVGLGATARLVTRTVGATLSAAAPPLDLLIESALSAAGISIGEADIRPAGVRCMSAALVG